MQFSVIIPTRNRPETLKVAIMSVLNQTSDDFEIIVVNDGSDDKYDEDYLKLSDELGEKVQILHIEKSWNGHGPNYPRNMGVRIAKGDYLCFLDDDDEWIDENHLSVAYETLKQSKADVYFTNQKVYFNNECTFQQIWLAKLDSKIDKSTKTLINGAYPVTINELLSVDGFCHLNTSIVKKELFFEINGFDEHIPYEEDRAFYYRVIDAAKLIFHFPKETSRHNVPDATKQSNVSTSVLKLERMLSRLSFLNYGIVQRKNEKIRDLLKKHRMYTLKAISEELYQSGDYRTASHYANEALIVGFNVKWLLFTSWLFFRAIFENKEKK